MLATALFSIAAVMAKVAVVDFHVLQILFFRQIVVFLSSLPTLVNTFPNGLKTHYAGTHALRLMGAFIALSCSIWALAVLPLSTAVTLGFAQVFFVALLASMVLNEVIGVHRVVAIVAGFIGVVIVMQPGVDGIANINTLIPLGGAMGAAVAVTSVRKLSSTESTATLLLYQSVFVGVLAGVPLFWLWETPSFTDFLFLITLGVIAAVAQWVGIYALRLAEASVVSTIKYSELLFASLLGYFVFSELPDKSTVLGAAVIVCSALYLYQREIRSK